jgi:S-adenosylmethionine hydrolase
VSPLVTFLTDYGYLDEFAGSARLVIERLAPGTGVLELTHGIPAGDVRRGALALEAAAARAGTVVWLAVVDPGVGTKRRAVAIRSGDGSHFVGPDNGLLALGVAARGGAAQAVDISRSPLRLEPVSQTFHGRDIFAPVAAHLASGRPLEAAGDAIEPSSLAALEMPTPQRDGDALVAHVLFADGFGNLILDAHPDDLPDGDAGAYSVAAGERTVSAVRASTFADGDGGLVIVDDSSGRLAVALDGGSASEHLGVGRDAELRIASQ